MDQQMNQNQSINPGTMGQKFNHGAHEILDMHEVLGGVIGMQEQYLMFRQNIQDQELINILDHQKQFVADQYNIMVECFSTGQDPSKPTSSYKMNQNNNVTYGLTPSQPKKPKQSVNEINDQCYSSFMMALCKTNATALTTASLESTNPVVRRVLADSIPNFVEMAYEIFLYQNKNGYYQVPQLQQQDMQQMINSYAPTQGMSQIQQKPLQ
ncbi:spore coat protein CotF [Salirhabdus euzebyi]|uniref:Spore coat protein CotF n=1 Tax=Salirhabdus euzebyi TaxID=394506 RepID=A0A841QAT9_9BACI|nr:spore coat protein [Salirhabdus euzebyi]MBB6455403.1 spore coat protein CotF [Salirhabdus euzebyi]